MAKSSKATVLKRVQEVTRLILAGAEFPDLRQYAAEQDWKVSERQLHRYMSMAHKNMAKAVRRNTEELVGRHLMQRRALYARCIKANDLRTALSVLMDEASLQGIYPPKKIAPTSPDGEQPYVMQTQSNVTLVSLQERVVRLVMADATQDRTAARLVRQSSPRITYEASDTHHPQLMLNLLAAVYATEQLEQMALVFHTLFLVTQRFAASAFIEPGDTQNPIDLYDPAWAKGEWWGDYIAGCAAYRFRVGKEGWDQFTQSIRVDGKLLVQQNYRGTLLHACEQDILNLAPTLEELESLRRSLPGQEEQSVNCCTAESLCSRWRKYFMRACRDVGV
jgi:hypothetical protein